MKITLHFMLTSLPLCPENSSESLFMYHNTIYYDVLDFSYTNRGLEEKQSHSIYDV